MQSKMVDFHHVEPQHLDIDDRLKNWARWVKPGQQNWVSPMFAQYRSKAWQWHQPEIKDSLDTLDAMKVEKAVSTLPDRNRRAVRWAYVVKCTPIHVFRALGIDARGLCVCVHEGRNMLINSLTK